MSSRAKLVAIAVIAVMLPTTVISYVQYRSLVELERQTRMAAQEHLRQAAGALSNKTAEYFREIGKATLAGIQFNRPPKSEQTQAIEQLFAAALQDFPAVESLFVISNCSCPGQEGAAIIRSRAGVRKVFGKSASEDREIRHIVTTYDRAVMLVTERGASTHDYLFAYHPPCDNHGVQNLVFYPLRDSAGAEVGFAGLQVDARYVIDELVPKVLLPLVDANIAVAIRDDAKRLLYTNKERDSYQLEAPFSPVFPQWVLGVDYRTASIEELAQNNFRQSMMLSGFVLLLLVTGIVLTLRATAREMRLAEVKSAFVSNVSHELKTPLSLIRLFAETLELGRVKSPEKTQEYYRIINNESTRLTHLINNILDFSKIEAGRKEYVFENTDAGQIVEEVIRTYEQPIRHEGFELHTRIEHPLPPVKVDRGAISQAVLNLLNNAVKYSDSVKQIGVDVRAVAGHVLIEVTDKGIGIPASEHQRIFDQFYRISTGLVHDRKGTGLGLTLVKHIVDAHQGMIHVNSAPGKGSSFTIALPALSAAETQASPLAYEGSDYRR
ncbi:MAG: HAMP domain-containing histidine kinase [Acidobacteria bacterium]|nr:HAMP domain-containing histidine kinase [Acidobacteriota bacterium]